MTDANELLMSGGIPAAKFDVLGTIVMGTIVDPGPKAEQMRKFDQSGKPTAELDFWPSGDPKMHIICPLQTTLRDPENPDDTGVRNLFIGPRMMKVIRDAVMKAGAKGLAVGGTVAVKWVAGTGSGAGNPKEYVAEYKAPELEMGSMLGIGAAPAPTAPMIGQPAPTAPATPSPMAAATATIANAGLLGGATTQPSAPPPGIQPETWAALPDPQKQAILAAMAGY